MSAAMRLPSRIFTITLRSTTATSSSAFSVALLLAICSASGSFDCAEAANGNARQMVMAILPAIERRCLRGMGGPLGVVWRDYTKSGWWMPSAVRHAPSEQASSHAPSVAWRQMTMADNATRGDHHVRARLQIRGADRFFQDQQRRRHPLRDRAGVQDDPRYPLVPGDRNARACGRRESRALAGDVEGGLYAPI